MTNVRLPQPVLELAAQRGGIDVNPDPYARDLTPLARAHDTGGDWEPLPAAFHGDREGLNRFVRDSTIRSAYLHHAPAWFTPPLAVGREPHPRPGAPSWFVALDDKALRDEAGDVLWFSTANRAMKAAPLAPLAQQLQRMFDLVVPVIRRTGKRLSDPNRRRDPAMGQVASTLLTFWGAYCIATDACRGRGRAVRSLPALDVDASGVTELEAEAAIFTVRVLLRRFDDQMDGDWAPGGPADEWWYGLLDQMRVVRQQLRAA